ncbi:PepSY-associated TM helix domain-containing protein [Pseudomonas sp. NPDC088444]|uniref:PepSY-associated TM helix domain-containing protein n=1 Tax=Pseudomonas sp. NPDC088444 TaxID=3364456 RepID=UPI00384E9529
MKNTQQAPRNTSLYRLVWRWHFYAGLFCIPFVLALALTGTAYLFHPQIDSWLDAPYNHIDPEATRLPPSRLVEAAIDRYPGSRLNAFQLPTRPTDAAQVLVGKEQELYRVYLDPTNAQVLFSQSEDKRLTRQLFNLHGELLMGSLGSVLIELAACWTIVMLLSGLYLWWPKDGRIAGVLYPRLSNKGRLFWRDLHAVVGFWVSIFAVMLILTGLPWAQFWGGSLKTVREWAANHAVQQDWTTGKASEMAQRQAMNSDAIDEHANMPGMAGMAMHAVQAPAPSYAPLDNLVPRVAELELAFPVLISPPSGHSSKWTARSDASNRPMRVNLVLDAQQGQISQRTDFSQRPLLDRIIGYGVAAHEGQLFGWPNVVLGIFTTVGLMTLTISGAVLWWRRRPTGLLGAPSAVGDARLPWKFVLVLVGLGVYLPLLGVSLVLVWAIERWVLSAIPATARYLGLVPRSKALTG